MATEQAFRVAELAAQVGQVRDEYVLQAHVFVAQELKLLDTAYAFDFRRNLPFSSELSCDLHALIEENVIRDTRGTNSLVSVVGPSRETSKPVCRLRDLEPGDLFALSRVLSEMRRIQDISAVAKTLRERDRVSASCLANALSFVAELTA